MQGRIMLNCVIDISRTFASEQFQDNINFLYLHTLLCWRKSSIWRHKETQVCDANGKKCDCSEGGICKLTLSRTWSIVCGVSDFWIAYNRWQKLFTIKSILSMSRKRSFPLKTMVVFLCLRLHRSHYLCNLNCREGHGNIRKLFLNRTRKKA